MENNNPFFLSNLNIQNQKETVGEKFNQFWQPIDKEIQEEYEIQDFQILSILGYGGSGCSVEKVKHIPTGIIMAKKVEIIKAIPYNFSDDSKKQILSELKTLKRCNSVNIIKAYGSFINVYSYRKEALIYY